MISAREQSRPGRQAGAGTDNGRRMASGEKGRGRICAVVRNDTGWTSTRGPREEGQQR